MLLLVGLVILVLLFLLVIFYFFSITFIIKSQQLLRFLYTIFSTIILTFLVFDIAFCSHYNLHLIPLTWELFLNTKNNEMTQELPLIFICVPIIFLTEMLFATWSWRKLRSLNRQRFTKPLVSIFIVAFITLHLIYIWADANFYRPITMQRTNYPLSHPMTARKFLERYGYFD